MGNRAGRREIERETKVGREIEVQCWLNRPTETKKRGKQRIERGRTHLAGRRQLRSLAHLPVREEPRGPAHLCRCARTRAALGISAARAAPPPLCLRAAPPLLVHGPMRPRLRAPPLLVRGLMRPLQDCNGRVIPSLCSGLLVCCSVLSGLPSLCSACDFFAALLVLALLYAWLCQPFKINSYVSGYIICASFVY